MSNKALSSSTKKIISSVIILVLAAIFGITKFGGSDSDTKSTAKSAERTTAAVTEQAQKTTEKAYFDGYTFRSSKQLTQHFEKHGREVGAKSENEYVDMANAVINNPSALYKTEAEDGDHIYFLKSTGEIVFVSTDGFIRTYFISDEDYFNRQ